MSRQKCLFGNIHKFPSHFDMSFNFSDKKNVINGPDASTHELNE